MNPGRRYQRVLWQHKSRMIDEQDPPTLRTQETAQTMIKSQGVRWRNLHWSRIRDSARRDNLAYPGKLHIKRLRERGKVLTKQTHQVKRPENAGNNGKWEEKTNSSNHANNKIRWRFRSGHQEQKSRNKVHNAKSRNIPKGEGPMTVSTEDEGLLHQ